MESTEIYPRFSEKSGVKLSESEGATPLLNGLRGSALAGDGSSAAVANPRVPVAGFPYGEGEEKNTFLSPTALLSTSCTSTYSERSDFNDSMLRLELEARRPRRYNWSSSAEFVLACIGYTVGLGNIWRFPYLCYKHGGGAFLIPYFIILIFCGIPLLYLELAVGQYTRMGPIGALEKICPLFKGAGLATVVVSFLMCTYYNVIVAWTLFYLFNSLRGDLPWTKCNNTWNTPLCWDRDRAPLVNQSSAVASASSATTSGAGGDQLIPPNDSKTPAQEFYDRKVLEISEGIDRPGDMRWELVLALFVAWVLVYLAICKSVKSSGKVVYFTATLPYILLVAFLVRSLMLDGALQGLLHFSKPNWDVLLEHKVWVDAAVQNFHSLGIAFGTLIAYASYNKFNNNILRDTLIVGFVDSATSILSGCVVFSTIGHIAHKHNKDFDVVIAEGSSGITHGPGVIFVAYPTVLAQMPLPHIWAVLFFALLLFLALDSQFATVEVIVTSLRDAFGDGFKCCLKRHEVLVLVVCLMAYVCGLPNVSRGGIYFFQLIDYYSASISLMYLAFFEVIAIVWFYGAGRLSRNIQEMTGSLPSIYFRLCWWIITPLLILAVWVFSLMEYKPLTYDRTYRYPDWAEGLGWGIAFVSIVCIPVLAVKAVCKAPGRSLWGKMRNAIQSPLPDDATSDNPGTSSYSLRMSGSRSSATVPSEEAVAQQHTKHTTFPPHSHELVKVEQIVSTV